jgi:glucose-1-phosphate adenylyltransferase
LAAAQADAVYQNKHLTRWPDLVAVFSADHIYRMNVGQMIAEHQPSRRKLRSPRPGPAEDATGRLGNWVDRDWRIVGIRGKAE